MIFNKYFCLIIRLFVGRKVKILVGKGGVEMYLFEIRQRAADVCAVFHSVSVGKFGIAPTNHFGVDFEDNGV